MSATTTDLIPVLDVGPFLAGEDGALDALASRLHDALARVGFFFVIGHDVPTEAIAAVYREAERFHAQPAAAKEAILMDADHAGYLRLGGGTSYASAIAGEVRKPNLNAAYFVYRETAGPSNQWPDLDGFQEVVSTYFNAMESLARRLLPLYAAALELPLTWFDPFFEPPSCTLRMSHYPVVDHDDAQWGLAPHTDSTFMTLLPANDVPGLWIRPEGHDWIEPPALPGSFLVNSGDILRRWSNDRFLSTAHRAMNASGQDRYAIPFFFGAADDAEIVALPTCVSEERPAIYPPTTYGAYQRWFRNRNYAAYTGTEVDDADTP